MITTWYPDVDLDHDDTLNGMSLVRVSRNSTAGRSIDRRAGEQSMLDEGRDVAAVDDDVVVDTSMELDWIVNVHGWHRLMRPHLHVVVRRAVM